MDCCTGNDERNFAEKALNRLTTVVIKVIAAFFRCLGWRACRFYPSCSVYAAAAFGRFGFWRAAALTLGRLSKCHPFCAGGHDPLPEAGS